MTIAGVVGSDDREVGSTIDRIAEALGRDPNRRTLSEGVALASWADSTSPVSLRFADDRAYVGTLEGDVPGPGVELRGDFAMISRAEGCLRLARGRFAGRPLYWMRLGGTTVASSRLLPLALLGNADLRLDVDYVLSLFDPVLTLFRQALPFVGTERVRANTIVEIDSVGRAQTFEGPLRFEPELSLSIPDLANELRTQFRAAVGRQSRGARRVGVLTGGGVDSSNVLAAAVQNHRHHGGPEVVPLAFDFGGEGDDRPHLRALCQHLGVEPIRIVAAEGAAFGMRGRIVDGQLFQILPAAIVLATMARARAAGVDRLLDGVDSELIFDADGSVFGDFLLHQPLAALGNALRFQAIRETRPQLWRRIIVGPLLRHVLPRFVVDARGRAARSRAARAKAASFPWAGPRLAAFLATADHVPRPRPIGSQRHRVSMLARSSFIMENREYASRLEIACGVRVCRPYLDDEFLSFMARVPSAAIFAGARDRGLLRESMTGCVPESLRNRMDKARPREALAEALALVRHTPELRDLSSMRELDALGIVDAKSFRTAFDRVASDPLRDDGAFNAVWAAIAGEEYVRWFRQFAATSTPRDAARELAALRQ